MKVVAFLGIALMAQLAFADRNDLNLEAEFTCYGAPASSWPDEIKVSVVDENGYRRIRVDDRSGSNTIVVDSECYTDADKYVCTWGAGKELVIETDYVRSSRGFDMVYGLIRNYPRWSTTTIRCFIPVAE